MKTRPSIIDNKELMSEWDWDANIDLDPNAVTYGSHIQPWWKCPTCGYKWKQIVCDMVRKNRRLPYCPCCENRILIKGKNDLASKCPEIAREWDYDKNTNLRPDSVTFKYCKSVWWKCPKGHSYEQRIDSRTLRGTGCPYCAGLKVFKGFNDLATTNPALAKEWHPTKNLDLTPYDVTANSTKNVWWLCPVGHEYQRTVHQRYAAYTNCPICDSRKRTSFPEQAVYFYLKKLYPDALSRYRIKEKSNMELDIYIPSIKFAVEYDGASWHKTEEHHERERKKYNFCKDRGITLIRVKEKTGSRWDDVCDHAYYIKTVKRNDLHELEKIIHYILDSICTSIDDLLEHLQIGSNVYGQNQEAYYIPTIKPFKLFHHNIDVDLERDKAEIQNYVFKIENSLADLRPDVARKWNHEKNGRLTPDMFSVSSDEPVWWKCPECGHEWKISINSMTGKKRGGGCAVCSASIRAQKSVDTKIKKRGSLATVFPEIARSWHPTKNGTLTSCDVAPGSAKRVWWLCEKCGYEWLACPHDRQKGRGCPHCAGKVPMVGVDDLGTTHPDLMKDWDYDKNININPQKLKAGSNKAVWWKCHKCGHNWQAVVEFRAQGFCRCPNCKKQNKQLKFVFNY